MNTDGGDKLDRAVRRAFQDAPELVAREGDDARIAGAVDRALLAVDARPKPSFLRFRSLGYFAAAAVCVAALAYAANHRSSRPSSAIPSSATTGEVPREPSGAAANAPSSIRESAASATSPTSSTVSGLEGSAITPDVLPSVPAPPRLGRPSAAPTTAPRPEPTAEATVGPAELFAQANEARRANETRRAVGLYEELQTRFPESREASTSRVALGRLLLDREGEPERARRLFDAYLGHDPSGALAEEARVGRALASLRLGDRQAERAAWLELLEHHPGSVHAERARQRLVLLGD